jgi:hypothetical protein
VKPPAALWDVIAHSLQNGHSATILCATDYQARWAISAIRVSLERSGVKFSRDRRTRLDLENGAWCTAGQLWLQGASYCHTPILVFVDKERCKAQAVKDAYYIATSYPDGRPPTVID